METERLRCQGTAPSRDPSQPTVWLLACPSALAAEKLQPRPHRHISFFRFRDFAVGCPVSRNRRRKRATGAVCLTQHFNEPNCHRRHAVSAGGIIHAVKASIPCDRRFVVHVGHFLLWDSVSRSGIQPCRRAFQAALLFATMGLIPSAVAAHDSLGERFNQTPQFQSRFFLFAWFRPLVFTNTHRELFGAR